MSDNKIQKITLEGKIFNAGYRVLTTDLKSLGLRRNPNIIQYPVGEWLFLPKDQISEGISDWGGIWVARTLSNAKKLVDYMSDKHSQDTRLFKCAIDKVLYSNSYRVKTNGIFLLEEI